MILSMRILDITFETFALWINKILVVIFHDCVSKININLKRDLEN